ncbi:MAG TPA: NAD(P)-binding domain-containing protein [Candidatus Dormibacteraeota bacterium]
MAVQADTATADERAELARAVETQIEGHPEWILLSTCHRVELYGFGARPDLHASLQVEAGEEAVRHLIRVATGLESAIVGEDEVLHQVREALGQARASRALDRRLQRWFETAIAAGRRSRAGRTATSGTLAQRAVAWLAERSSFGGRPVLVVGAGRMGSSLAHSARLAGGDVIIASRDVRRAQRLAQVYGGRGVDLADGAKLAVSSAAIAVALAGVWHELLPRAGELPPIADVSAPTAVPEAVRALANGDFLGIDDLYVRSPNLPRGYIDEADGVVASKTLEFVGWLERGR